MAQGFARAGAAHDELHSISSHDDTTATGAELETLTDGSETTLHSHAAAGGAGDLMHAEQGLGSTLSLTGSKQVVLNEVLTLSAGNIYVIEFGFNILNNSGASRVYVVYLDIGTVFSADAGFSVAIHATSRRLYFGRYFLTVASSSLAQITGMITTNTGPAAEDFFASNGIVVMGWKDTTSDVTGSQDISVEVASNNAAATQTLYKSFLTVRELPTT